MLDDQPSFAAGFRGRMPDSTNLGPQGHGVVGPVSLSFIDDSLVIVGRYSGGQGLLLRSTMLIGLLVGLAVGYALTRRAFESESIWITLAGAAVWAAFMFAGVLLPMVLVKRRVLRTAGFAELTIALTAIDFMKAGSPVDAQEPTVQTVLSWPLAGWLMTRLTGSGEVLLTAPTEKHGRQVLRIVMPNATVADGFVEELRSRRSLANQKRIESTSQGIG